MSQHDASGPVPTIAGPTAVGKTALSLEVAERLATDDGPAEIISADSRQVYRGLDIGTAKPSAEARARTRHHFIDEKDLGEDFSAGAFAEEAHARIDAIRARGRRAIVAGGSTLYLHALHFGLADIPDVPDAVRDQLKERLDREGADALFDEL
ncbi:MAG: tRNA (adenosine(37)-N6)-dimethylallyltransferase MiaA, partial [Bacteroidetes bacterium QS_1_65_9]